MNVRPGFYKTHWQSSMVVLMRVATPLSFGFLLQTVMTTTDVFVVASLGVVELSAFTVASAVYALLFLVVVGLCSATVPFIAEHIGAGRRKAAISTARGGLAIVGIAASIGILLLLTLTHLHSGLGLSQEAMRSTALWAFCAAPGFFAISFFVWIRSVCTATQSARFVVRVTAVAALLNLFLTTLLTVDLPYAFNWGIAGTGIAGSIVRLVLLFLAFRAAQADPDSRDLVQLERPTYQDVKMVTAALNVGFLVIARILLVEGLVYISVLILPHLISERDVATHSMGLRLVGLSTTFALGLSSASSSLIAQARGALNADAAMSLSRSCLLLASALGVSASLVFLLGSHPIIVVAGSHHIEMTQEFIVFLAAYQTLVCLQIAASGILLGYKETFKPILATVVGPWIVGFSTGVFLVTHLTASIDNFWIGLLVGQSVSCFWCVYLVLSISVKKLQIVQHP